MRASPFKAAHIRELGGFNEFCEKVWGELGVLTAGKLSPDLIEGSPIQLSRNVQADFFGSK